MTSSETIHISSSKKFVYVIGKRMELELNKAHSAQLRSCEIRNEDGKMRKLNEKRATNILNQGMLTIIITKQPKGEWPKL